MADLRLTTNISYSEHIRCRADLVTPEIAEERPVVLCIHGGWWQRGRRHDLLPMAIALAERGIPAATIGYRLLNDGAADGTDIVADIQSAIATVCEEASIHGCSPKAVWLLGSGAGGPAAVSAAVATSAANYDGPESTAWRCAEVHLD